MELPRHDSRQVANQGTPSTDEYRYRRVLDKNVKDNTDAIALKANIASPTFTGNPAAPTPTAGDNDTSIATTAFVTTAVAAGAAGHPLQTLQNVYTTNADITATIPLDDTTPLISEGTEVLTQAITVAATANKVRAQVVVNGAVSNASTAFTTALFRGTACIDAKANTFPTQNFPATVTMDVLDSPATAGAVTYSVRVGPSSNTARLNGSAVGRQFGGTSKCTLTVTEIKG